MEIKDKRKKQKRKERKMIEEECTEAASFSSSTTAASSKPTAKQIREREARLMAVIREHERKETEEKRALVKAKHGKDATSLAKVVCTSGTSSKVAGNKRMAEPGMFSDEEVKRQRLRIAECLRIARLGRGEEPAARTLAQIIIESNAEPTESGKQVCIFILWVFCASLMSHTRFTGHFLTDSPCRHVERVEAEPSSGTDVHQVSHTLTLI